MTESEGRAVHGRVGKHRAELGARVAAAMVLAPVALLLAWLGGLVFALACLGIGLVVLVEWNSMARSALRDAPFWTAIAALVGTALALVLLGPLVALAVLVGGVLGLLAAAAKLRAAPWLAAGLLYAAVPVLAGPVLRADPALGFLAVLWLFGLVWATDIAAYFVGRAVGGPKLAPAVSPGKTWSGALGGLAACLLVTAGFAFAFVSGGALLPLLALAALAGIAAQLGDLLESALKRRFGAKDASRLIPGHGGMMDRVDGLVAAAAFLALFGWVRGGGNAAAGLLAW